MPSSYWDRNRAWTRRGVLRAAGGAGLGAAALAAAGCGDDDASSTPARGASTSAPGAAGAATSAPSAAASPTARVPAGDLVVALSTLSDQVADPHLQSGANPLIIMCFEQFFRWDTNGRLRPALASKMEESPDHLKLVFTLRPDATFWDGTPVTSDDVKWSFDRYISLPPGDSYAPNVRADVKSVETPDKGTVVVNMNVANRVRLTRGIVAPRGWNIASRAYYEKVGEDTFKKQPMATGPFKLVGNEKGLFFKLEAHAGHYERVPAFKTIRADLVADPTTRVARIKTGEADYIDAVIGQTRRDLQADSSLKIYESLATGLPVLFFQKLNDAPYNDVRVRRALRYAIDQDAIITGLLAGGGAKSPGVNFYPITDGWDPAKFPPQEFNLDKAKAELAAAGLAGGFKTRLSAYISGGTPMIPEQMEALVSMWKKINVDASLEVLDSTTYLARYRNRQLDGIAPLGTAANLSADFSQKYYLSTDIYPTDSPPETQAKIRALSQELDDTKYVALAQEVYKELIDNVTSMTMPFTNTAWAVRKSKVANWSPITGNPYPNAWETLIPA